MSPTPWRSTKAGRVLAALLRTGWTVKRQAKGSHSLLAKPGFPNFVWAFHEREEILSKMLARISKRTGLQPEDL